MQLSKEDATNNDAIRKESCLQIGGANETHVELKSDAQVKIATNASTFIANAVKLLVFFKTVAILPNAILGIA